MVTELLVFEWMSYAFAYNKKRNLTVPQMKTDMLVCLFEKEFLFILSANIF